MAEKIFSKSFFQISAGVYIDKRDIQYRFSGCKMTIQDIGKDIQQDTEDCERKLVIIPDILYFFLAFRGLFS